MASARVHEVIAQIINRDYNFDEMLLRIGTIAPDSWRNVPKESGIKDKYLSHFWDFSVEDGKQANDYVKFYTKYNQEMSNPFYFGYLLHLIVDQYWKSVIDPRYEKEINGEKYYIDKNGNIIKNENNFDYYESIKMQQRLAKKYKLDVLPIYPEDYKDFSCNIEELNLSGLFGENGTIAYTNNRLFMNDAEESSLYDDESIEKAINETVEFVKRELNRLKQIDISDIKPHTI